MIRSDSSPAKLQFGRDMALRYFISVISGFAPFNKIRYDYYKQFLNSDELKIVSKLQKEMSG